MTADSYTLTFETERGLYAAKLSSPEHTVTTQFYATKEEALDAAFSAISGGN